VSRKTNIKGYRLGEASWWQTRTPPRLDRDFSLFFTDSLIKGMFHKFGYLLSEVMIHRKIGSQGKIILLGKHFNNLIFRKKRKSLFRSLKKWERKDYIDELRKERRLATLNRIEKPKLTVYLVNFIKEFLLTYFQKGYNISYREVKKLYQESNILLTYITKSNLPIIKMMRRVQRQVKLDSRRRQPKKLLKFNRRSK